MEDLLKFEYHQDGRKVFPTHPMVKNWVFGDDEEDEALLAHFMAKVAEKNGMNANDVMHIFPATLRMLKSESPWTK